MACWNKSDVMSKSFTEALRFVSLVFPHIIMECASYAIAIVTEKPAATLLNLKPVKAATDDLIEYYQEIASYRTTSEILPGAERQLCSSTVKVSHLYMIAINYKGTLVSIGL